MLESMCIQSDSEIHMEIVNDIYTHRAAVFMVLNQKLEKESYHSHSPCTEDESA